MAHDRFSFDYYEGVLNRAYEKCQGALDLPLLDIGFVSHFKLMEKQLKHMAKTKVQDFGSQTGGFGQNPSYLETELGVLKQCVEDKRDLWSTKVKKLEADLLIEKEVVKRLKFQNKLLKRGLRTPSNTSTSHGLTKVKREFPIKESDVVEVPNKKRRPTLDDESQCSQEFEAVIVKKPKVYRDNEPRPFPCTQCDSRFKSKRNLQSHVFNVHGSPVQCDECTQVCANKGALRIHKATIHVDDPQTCPTCNEVYRSPVALKTHQRKHTKTFQCQTCPKKFATRQHLSNHERTHSVLKKSKNSSKITENRKLSKFAAAELKRLSSFRRTHIGKNIEIKIKGNIFVKTDSSPKILHDCPIDPAVHKTTSILLYIPFKKKFQTPTCMGHFVSTTNADPFQRIYEQIGQSGKEVKGGGSCTHASLDMLDEKEYDYENYIFVAAADSAEAGADLKFTANAYCPVTNRMVKEPSVNTVWDPKSKEKFLRQLKAKGVPPKPITS